MDWDVHTEPDGRFGVVTGYLGTIIADDWEAVAKQLPVLWEKLCDVMIRHHGPYPPQEWDAFLCMVRPDGGTIHIAPIRLPWKAHTERTWVMVDIPLMEEEYFRLPDPDSDAAGFEVAHGAIMRRLFDAIRQSADSPECQACLHDLFLRHPFVVYGIQYDDRETMADLRIPTQQRTDETASKW